MQIAKKHEDTPAQSCTNRVERRHRPKVDYYSELRSWVQHAILEAEKSKDFSKKDQLLSILKEL